MSALKDLRNSLISVNGLINLEGRYSDPPSLNDREIAFGLRGAITVLTLACFEGFISSLFEEELDRIIGSRIPLRFYNDKLRVEAIFSSLELAMKGDHSTRNQERIDRLANVISTAHAISVDSFVPRSLCSTQSNPNAETVKRMFRAVGRSGVWDIRSEFELLWGSPVASTYCADTLDALVASRNKVAHTADAAHVTRREMVANVHFIETLAAVLTADLHRHISKLIIDAQAARANST